MEDLSLDFILTDSEIDGLNIEETQEEAPETEETEDTTEVQEEEPESVGSGKENNKQEEAPSSKGGSPNVFSSIAKAFVEEGIFPDIEEEKISNIKSPEDFRELVEERILHELGERQKRIDDALSSGMPISEIQRMEQTIQYLNNITEDDLSVEDENTETLRKNLIWQDAVNRGYSKEKAIKIVERSINQGTDIEDALEALEENKTFYNNLYENRIKEMKKERDNEAKEIKKREEALKEQILNTDKVLGDLSIDKNTRKKIYDNLSKPVYKDPNSGKYLTAIQKYQKENPYEFVKNLSLVYTLTDGFKNLDGLVKGKVKKEVKKGLRELENTLNNTARDMQGNLNFMNMPDDDKDNSPFKDGWMIGE